jgi:hypothetical protein
MSMMLALCLSLSVTVACSRQTRSSPPSLAERIDQRLEMASLSPPLYKTATEAMPTTSFQLAGQAEPVYASDLFVVGRVVEIVPESSFAWPGGPSIVGEPSNEKKLPFNGSGAEISDIAFSVSVDKAVAREPSLESLTSVKVGLALPSPVNLDEIRKEYPPGTRIAAILVSNDKTTFHEDSNLFGFLGYGAFLGEIDKIDIVHFPAWTEGREVGAPEGTPLSQLLTPISGPIPVSTSEAP